MEILLRGTLMDGLFHLESVSVKTEAGLGYSNNTKQQFIIHQNKGTSTFVLTGGTNHVNINVVISKVIWHKKLEHSLLKF